MLFSASTLHAALQDVVARIGEPVGAGQTRLPVVGARLVGLVVQVEPGQRDRVAEPVIDLAGVHVARGR